MSQNLHEEMIIKKHEKMYYSPYSNKMFVKYPYINKVICTNCKDAKCDIPDSKIDEDGNILFYGIHDYPIKGKTQIMGKFKLKIPVYAEKYVLYEEHYSTLTGNYRLHEIRTLSDEEIDHLIFESSVDDINNDNIDDIDDDSYDSDNTFPGGSFWIDKSSDDITIYKNNYYVVERKKYISGYNVSDTFELNELLDYERYFDRSRNKNMFRHCQNIRSIKIKVLDEHHDKNNDDVLTLVVNNYGLDLPINKEINFDNLLSEYESIFGDIYNNWSVVSLVQKYPTYRFQEYYLTNGKHANYEIEIIDHCDPHMSI